MNRKIFTSLLCILLSLFMAFAAGCARKTPEVTESAQKSPLENTLHDVTVTDSQREFVVNAGKENASTQYKLLVGNGIAKLRAANFISTTLSTATGASFAIVEYDPEGELAFGRESKYIAIGCDELFADAGQSMPDADLGFAGYYIVSYGDSVFIQADLDYGYQLGALAFLRAAVGYDMIDEDCLVFDKSGETLPDMRIAERPDFDFRNYTNWMTDNKLYGMGYDTSVSFMGVNGVGFHNCHQYLPPDKYYNSADPENYHPKWYSENSTYRQLCYTAHGDAQEYQAMLEASFEVLKKTVDENPEKNIVTFTQLDAPYCCECSACNAVVAKDGSISATIIRFMNDLDDMLQEYLNGERTVILCFFAYHTSLEAPSTTVEEDPTLKCNPNVCVIIAPISANYTIALDEGMNEAYAEGFSEWSHYADKIMAWVYECNYHWYLYPYNTYSSMVDTYYFLKQNNAFYIYNEGQRINKNVPCFGKFKEYLDAKAQFDVTVNYNDLEEKFFSNYFLDAADVMKDLFDQIVQWETYLETESSFGLDGGIYQEVADEKYWPRGLIESWLGLIDEAYEKVEHYKNEDAALYAKLCKRINIESIFMRFVQCTILSYTYSADALQQMRQSFKEDCAELSIVEYREHEGELTALYSSWGI